MDALQLHPAYLAHCKGLSVTYASGRDYTAYLISLADGEYILTEWNDGSVGIQRV